MVIRKNGNVGFGYSSPGYKLHVNGDAAKPGGNLWTVASDEKLKRNIQPYHEGLAKILSIRPVTFQYNELAQTDVEVQYVGVIAQELQQVDPSMVGTSMINGVEYLDVDASPMLYMLINAVKELNETIQQQQKQIDALQQQVEGIR